MNIKDVLTLSDKNEYVIASKIDYESKTYLYLIDINDNGNIKVCSLDNDELTVIKDKDLVKKIFPDFFKKMKKDLRKV